MTSRILAASAPGHSDEVVKFTCAQVPTTFEKGSDVWVWLGSDNNKGQPTDWDQGVRAFGRCVSKIPVQAKNFDIEVQLLYVLPRSIAKAEFLDIAPSTYADSLADTPIVGLNNYSSQVIQALSDEEFLTLGAVIARILPESAEDIYSLIEGAAAITVIERDAEGSGPPELVPEIVMSELPDDDPIFLQVKSYVEDDGVGGVLLTGAPGTGKSYHALHVGLKLVGGDVSRIRRVQFHPSYQYEDFVEGYVPRGAGGFTLEKKHLLLAADKASKTDGPVVLIIDEFSRTDPSRVLGECLTYMEGSLRGQSFLLPSGRSAKIPKNLIFLATMNPEDRSVDEIDAAMDRRWAKIELRPSSKAVTKFLLDAALPKEAIGPIITFFNELQKHLAVGHAFFRTVKDVPSLQRLWDSQLRHLVAKHYRYDKKGREAVDGQWETCRNALRAVGGEAELEATTSAAETPVPNAT